MPSCETAAPQERAAQRLSACLPPLAASRPRRYSTTAEDSPIKVADFGLARVISNKEMMKTACGTPGYVAPEVLKNKVASA